MKTQYKSSQHSLNMEKIKEIFNATDKSRDKIIIESLYYPALRRFEVAKMKIEDIDLIEGNIIVIGKGEKIAPIPVGSIFPEYITDLKHYINSLSKKEGYLFKGAKQYTKKGEKRIYKNGKHIEISRINQILNEAAEKAKIENPNPDLKKNKFGELVKRKVNPHLLRHSLARHLKDLRFPIEFIQNYMRHSSIKTTMDTYGTLGLEDMKRIAYKMRGIEYNPHPPIQSQIQSNSNKIQ